MNDGRTNTSHNDRHVLCRAISPHFGNELQVIVGVPGVVRRCERIRLGQQNEQHDSQTPNIDWNAEGVLGHDLRRVVPL
jgi:hypothetical protein